MIDVENKDSVAPLQLDEALALAERLMDEALETTPKPFRPRTAYLAKTHGKFLRAQALLISAQDENGVKPAAAKAAAAVELLHLATLVHDDVIDNADTRRRKPTLLKKFGPKQAVITGDYIFCLAMRLAAEAVENEKDQNNDIPATMEKICMGELLQSVNQRNFALSGLGYLRIIAGKTAALFEGSYFAGARLCPTPDTDAKQYAAIGWHQGMIFQLADDCMDYEATAEQAQKPVLSDYEQGVVTLPLIYAIKEKPEIAQRAAEGRIDKNEILQSVQETGGTLFTKRVARIYYQQAMRLIEKLNAPQFKKDQITSLLHRSMGLTLPE